MKYLLDTCVVSETRRREPNANLMNWLAEQRASDLFVEDVAPCFNGRILEFERGIADCWGRLMGEGIAKGLTPSVTDSMLAATALSHDMAVVTRNVSDFQFEGLQVINPFAG